MTANPRAAAKPSPGAKPRAAAKPRPAAKPSAAAKPSPGVKPSPAAKPAGAAAKAPRAAARRSAGAAAKRPPAARKPAGEVAPRPERAVTPAALGNGAAQLAGGADAPVAPFVGAGLRTLLGGLRFVGQQAVRQPQALLRDTPEMATELLRIGLGRSELAPEKGDKRFADPAWQGNRFYRTLLQSYLYAGSRVDRIIDDLGLQGMNAERARFALTLIREAMAPTNFFATNPAAIKRCLDTGGGSLLKGTSNWIDDLRHNHGMPAMVDRKPFILGKNIAATPGAVIHRTDVFELIQYTPQTAEVYQRPMLVVPPQVNRYYALDLAPGRSMYEYLLQQGIQVFGISWRNPTQEQRDWDFDTYARATIEAIDVVREVTGAPDVNLMGGCLGGMTVAIVQAYLAAQGDHRVNSATMTVTLVDLDSGGRMFLFATPQTLALARKVSTPRGVINGWQMASMFAWLRPNDLVWNYWVNNYLLGQDPPAFDILAWNADSTRLSSRFHHQMLDMVTGNELARPGGMTVLGTPIDVSRISCDTYVAAGRTDHITPWDTCYRTTQLVSGHSEFVLCSSGHIQTVVADPNHPRIGYYVNPDTPPSAEQWLADAERRDGSWWEHWVGWLAKRSGERVAAPGDLGSGQFPAIQPAPGSYIRS
jgi:polyhydroxyalkanoate synthase subunit PhaC